MDIADPSADVDSDEEMGDVAPRAVQKQEKPKRDKKDKKRDKKAKALANGEVEGTKRKHSERNGEAGGEKKKKKKSAIEQ
jgi:hypothetical protein